jgi:hypothetical protein
MRFTVIGLTALLYIMPKDAYALLIYPAESKRQMDGCGRKTAPIGTSSETMSAFSVSVVWS